ncbi:uncharacterized protein LOC132647191 [Meriones unguiculatus]|uniref:uncharacterized protein LOC132647191 n=1 Tax=Meriones unguiculatus TaxID=10047 RepID=UPI00293E6331|nr:uncharacterized protein LOC132647191 [Meriones unguiculatus]XP_060223150.1 uncharacterized protein LOC132647191 [Meriones unguiculatus]
MATAVAAAETARAAANGDNCCFGPVPGGGSTRLRWLPPGPAARDGRAAILEERRPRLPATCAPIGWRAGRGRLVTVSMAPARAGTEAGAGRRAALEAGGRRGRGPRRRAGRAREAPRRPRARGESALAHPAGLVETLGCRGRSAAGSAEAARPAAAPPSETSAETCLGRSRRSGRPGLGARQVVDVSRVDRPRPDPGPVKGCGFADRPVPA